jgi:SAM-dependent methyltransferase
MKVRDSGMPDEAIWESLFDVDLILERLGVDAGLINVAELGCGYGTFTLPVARRISGTLYTYDIDEVMVERAKQRVVRAGLTDVVVDCRDVLTHGFGLPPASQHGCLLFNILHHHDPVTPLQTAARCLRPDGRLFVIHWRHDPATPRGPSLSIRPRPQQIIAWAHESGMLELASQVLDLAPWHYGLVLVRRDAPREGLRKRLIDESR